MSSPPLPRRRREENVGDLRSQRCDFAAPSGLRPLGSPLPFLSLRRLRLLCFLVDLGLIKPPSFWRANKLEGVLLRRTSTSKSSRGLLDLACVGYKLTKAYTGKGAVPAAIVLHQLRTIMHPDVVLSLTCL